MAGLFDSLAKTAGGALDKIGARAGEMMDVKQYREQQKKVKMELAVAKRDCYNYVLKQYQNGEITDEALIELFKNVEELAHQHDELEAKIQEAHDLAKNINKYNDGNRLKD